MKKSVKYGLLVVLAIVLVGGVFFAGGSEFLQGRLSRFQSTQPAYDTSVCYETDTKKDYENEGTAFGTMSGKRESKFTDYCKGDILYEYYCEGKGVEVEEVDCVGEGYAECDGGVCVEMPEFPDLVVSDITYGYEFVINDEYPNGMHDHGSIVEICNLGKSGDFDGLGFKVSVLYEKEFVVDDLYLGYNECYHSQVIPYYLLGIPHESSLGEIHDFSAEVDYENVVEEINEENNSLEKSVNFPVCGDYVCEEGENYEFCPFDCEASCKSEFCNKGKVSIYSACVDLEYFESEVGCMFGSCEVESAYASPEGVPIDFFGGDDTPEEVVDPCSDEVLEEQSDLFNAYLDMQTEVYDCLADYFDYEPSMLNYVVGPESTNDLCLEPGGCGCVLGGGAMPKFMWQHHWNGFRPYGANGPTKAMHLLPDEHETVHSFARQMIHNAPEWFSEGIAFQTNERVQCDVQALEILGYQQGEAYGCTLGGDDYLVETPFDIQEQDTGLAIAYNVNLNDDFYKQLKNGDLAFSDFDMNEYRIGSLWMMGMRLDYDCEEFCIRDIVTELMEFEKDGCQSGEGCGVNPGWGMPGISGDHIDNSIIKEKAEEVVGEDLSPLFDLLEMEY